MAAALEAGVSRLFRIGGAHAVAALAYGTRRCRASTRSSAPATATSPPPRRSSPPTAASTSTPARPRSSSSRRAGPPAWIAADLIAQAEHDPDARAVLITPSRTLAARVAREVERAVPGDGPARDVAPRARRHHRHVVDRRGDGARQRRGARASRRRRRAAGGAGAVRGLACSSARGRRRSPATMRSARTTCCRRPAPRACAADCRRPTSCARSPCSG